MASSQEHVEALPLVQRSQGASSGKRQTTQLTEQLDEASGRGAYHEISMPKSTELRRAPRRRLHAYILGPWTKDFFATGFSVLCLVAILLVLLIENGKPLEDWSLRITPNAIIAFVTALAKSSCMLILANILGQLRWLHYSERTQKLSHLELLDDASRGPWGGIRLLYRARSMAVLASCASILVILALVLDPFVQLVFTFPTRMAVTQDQIARFSSATSYDTGAEPVDLHGAFATGFNVAFPMQAAIVSASFGSPPPFSLTCPTTNCTFPAFKTMGVCNTCEDVTAQATTKCVENHGSVPLNCTTSTPAGIALKWQTGIDADGAYATEFLSVAIDQEGTTGSVAELAKFAALKNTGLTQGETFPTKPSEVYQCDLTLCLKEFKEFAVHNGNSNQSTLAEPALHLVYSYPPVFMTFQTPNVSGSAKPQNYSVNFADFFNLQAYLQDLFTTDIEFPSGISDKQYSTAPNIGSALLRASNFTQRIQSIADAMTDSMRTSQNNLTHLTGQSYIVQSYIAVHWQWMIFPFSLIIASLVLLVLVARSSKSRQVEVWKSSSLPLLFCNLEADDKATYVLQSEKDMMAYASNTYAYLARGVEQYIFRKQA